MSELAEKTETHGSMLKVLGFVWRTKTDDFIFDLTALLDAVAKREHQGKCSKALWSHIQPNRLYYPIHGASEMPFSRDVDTRPCLG